MNEKLGEAIIVLGMHRSGTSAVTGTLSRFGVQLGKKLYAPHQGVNDKGYFEHSDIADVNDELLFELGSSWDDILPLDEEWWKASEVADHRQCLLSYLVRDFSNSALWGLKDPRICRLLPLWKDILHERASRTAYLLSVRHPLEVAESLRKRDAFSREKSLILWLSYVLDAELWTRGERRSVLLFDRLLADPAAQMSRLAGMLEIEFPADEEIARASVSEFISTNLRHQTHEGFDIDDSSSEIERLCDLAYSEFQYAGVSESGEVNTAVMDEIGTQFAVYRASFPSVLVEQLRHTGAERGKLEVLINTIFQSKSWVLGRPFRFVERLFGGRA